MILIPVIIFGIYGYLYGIVEYRKAESFKENGNKVDFSSEGFKARAKSEEINAWIAIFGLCTILTLFFLQGWKEGLISLVLSIIAVYLTAKIGYSVSSK